MNWGLALELRSRPRTSRAAIPVADFLNVRELGAGTAHCAATVFDSVLGKNLCHTGALHVATIFRRSASLVNFRRKVDRSAKEDFLLSVKAFVGTRG